MFNSCLILTKNLRIIHYIEENIIQNIKAIILVVYGTKHE